jgi:hypothetical protein
VGRSARASRRRRASDHRRSKGRHSMLGPAPTSSPLRDARHVTESVRLNHLWRAQGPRKVERAGLGNVASRCRHVPPTWGGANLGSATGPRPNLSPAPEIVLVLPVPTHEPDADEEPGQATSTPARDGRQSRRRGTSGRCARPRPGAARQGWLTPHRVQDAVFGPSMWKARKVHE